MPVQAAAHTWLIVLFSERNMEIERENRLLLEKMSMIVRPHGTLAVGVHRLLTRAHARVLVRVRTCFVITDGERAARNGLGQYHRIRARHAPRSSPIPDGVYGHNFVALAEHVI